MASWFSSPRARARMTTSPNEARASRASGWRQLPPPHPLFQGSHAKPRGDSGNPPLGGLSPCGGFGQAKRPAHLGPRKRVRDVGTLSPPRNQKILRRLRGRVVGLRPPARSTPLSAGFSSCVDPPCVRHVAGFQERGRCAEPHQKPMPIIGQRPQTAHRKKGKTTWTMLSSPQIAKHSIQRSQS